MDEPSSKTHTSYCVTHAPVMIPQDFIDFTIGLGRYTPVIGASISELDPEWHDFRPVAYGAAGSYAIPRAIRRNKDTAACIGICTHRKIVIRDPIGRESVRAPPMREAEIGELSALHREACQPREGHEFLVSAPIVIGNVVAHYGHYHKIIDLMDYLSAAIELGAIAASDVATFVTQTAIITGGCELGVYPRDWIVAVLVKLQSVGRLFLERHADRIRRYDDYNVRALAFLSERLGSFFLLQELVRRHPTGIPSEIFGSICCVVERGASYDGARVSRELD